MTYTDEDDKIVVSCTECGDTLRYRSRNMFDDNDDEVFEDYCEDCAKDFDEDFDED